MHRLPTRRVAAAELLKDLQRGPQISHRPGDAMTVADFERHYRLWAETWIIPEVERLVPELRERKVEQR